MATKKSTSKKPETKTAAKASQKASAAEKTVKSPRQGKVTVKTGVSVKKIVNIGRIRSLHLLAIGFFLLLAVVAGLFMGQQSYQLTISHLAQDALSSAIVPAERALYDVEIRWLLVGLLLVSMIAPALYLSRLRTAYERQLAANRYVPWRWVDFAITGALMVEIVMLLSGIQNLWALKLAAGLVVVSFLSNWLAERQNGTAPRQAKALFGIGLFSGLLPWALILASAIATVVYGGVSAPWYVYALYAVTLLGFGAVYRIQLRELGRKVEAWQKNYLLVERNYLVVNLLTKLAFAAVLIAGLFDQVAS